jgi:hypothetical protein
VICTMYPTFGIAYNSYVFGAPYSEEVKRRSSIFSTNLTMANADADRISLDLKSNFAAIAAARPIPHLELLCPFLTAVTRTTRGHDPGMTAKRVRRDKAALSSGCKPRPANRSSRKQPEQSWR